MFGSTSRISTGLVAGIGALAAVVAPVATSAPAQAATSSSGCTVTPAIPKFANLFNENGVKYVNYKIKVTCDAGRSVVTEQQRWEQDLEDREGDAEDDMYGESEHHWDFPRGIGRTTQKVTVQRTLPSLDGAGDDFAEVYQALRFRVKSNGVAGAWTDWELTDPQSIRH